MRLGGHLDAGIIENLPHGLARKTSHVIAPTGNGGQKLAQHLFGSDQRSVLDVHGAGGPSPLITRHEEREPVKRIGENPPQRFGNPYT